MNRIELRKNRQRWQRSRRSSFGLIQDGRYSQSQIELPSIEGYVGIKSKTHVTANNNNLVSINSGALRTSNEVIVWGDRLIGPGVGSQIF